MTKPENKTNPEPKTYKVGKKEYIQGPVDMGQFEAVLGLLGEIPYDELVQAVADISKTIQDARAKVKGQGTVPALLVYDGLVTAILNILPTASSKKALSRMVAILLKIEDGEAEALPLTVGSEVIRDFFTLNGAWQTLILSILRKGMQSQNPTT